MSSSLNRFLSIFNYTTVKRSSEYIGNIDYTTIEISQQNNHIVMSAEIEGSGYYHTVIVYDVSRDTIVRSQCTCPVGLNCKHGAALAQLFYNDFLDTVAIPHKTPIKPIQNIQQLSQQNTETQALSWLNSFKQTVENTPPPKKENAKQFIYILQQDSKLMLDVLKVKRNKNGEIQQSKSYITFDNIISQKIAIPKDERLLFAQIYAYANTQRQDTYYDYSSLTITHIPIEHFKRFIEGSECYWQNRQHSAALTWSTSCYTLSFEWQFDNSNQSEKLIAVLSTPEKSVIAPKKFQILYTEPLSYLDLEQHTVGAIDSSYQAALIHQLLAMPQIPQRLMSQVNEALQIHPLTKTLPPAKAIQDIPILHGELTPVIRFGGFEKITPYMLDVGYGLAEVFFEYTGGRIAANDPHEYFFGTHQGQKIRQHRDTDQEQQHFLQLQKQIPSLQWANKHPSIKALSMNKPSTAAVTATVNDWISHLIPINQLEALGWKVEHLSNSPFNIQQAQNIALSLTESKAQQDWFELGATIQDQQGNTYNLIDLLADLIKRHPKLLEAQHLEQLDDEGFFTITLGNGQPDLALLIKDVKPILQNLSSLLQQDSHGLDRYDAAQLLDVQHHLGMAWQTSDRLSQFAQQLKQGYQSTIATPQGFNGELRPYQQQGLAWLQFLRTTEHGGILADDMGLGKTAQTLAHLLIEKQAGHLEQTPALIIAPTSLMYNWFKEAQKFTPDLKVLVLQGQNRHQDFEKIPHHDIVLSTYPLLSRDEEQLQKYHYHALILDEAQNIKNPRAKAAQVVCQLKANHRLCLTGTPMENHLGELWSLFYFLMPGFLANQELFNKNYRHPIEKQGDNQKRQKLVNRIKPFMLRRLKTDVAKELPAKTTIEVNIDMNEQQSKLYEAVRISMQESLRQIIAQKGFKRSQILILDALLKLRQVCCHPSLLKLDSIASDKAQSAKLEHLSEMVREMVEEGRKILIFSQFTSMLQLIEYRLNTQKIDFVKLTGQTRKREEAINAFQSGQVPVFLISLKAGGVGLNLTAADTVIHYDPWWNPAAEEQASDRAWRIGQDKPVFVYKLITNQSIEEKILVLQKNKAQLAQSILSHDQESDIKLSEQDIMNLFERF